MKWPSEDARRRQRFGARHQRTRTSTTGHRTDGSCSTAFKARRPGAICVALPLDGQRQPFPVSQGPFGENRGCFSPDGRLVAFESNESGRYEIVVQTFPVAGRRVQVSTDGGTTPIWRADGRELYFRSQKDQLTVARITLNGTTVDVGETQVLFALPEGPNHPTG